MIRLPTSSNASTALLPEKVLPIDVTNSDYLNGVITQFNTNAIATLICQSDKIEIIKNIILKFIIEPIDIGHMLLFPKIKSYVRNGNKVEVELNLREYI